MRMGSSAVDLASSTDGIAVGRSGGNAMRSSPPHKPAVTGSRKRAGGASREKGVSLSSSSHDGSAPATSSMDMEFAAIGAAGAGTAALRKREGAARGSASDPKKEDALRTARCASPSLQRGSRARLNRDRSLDRERTAVESKLGPLLGSQEQGGISRMSKRSAASTGAAPSSSSSSSSKPTLRRTKSSEEGTSKVRAPSAAVAADATSARKRSGRSSAEQAPTTSSSTARVGFSAHGDGDGPSSSSSSGANSGAPSGTGTTKRSSGGSSTHNKSLAAAATTAATPEVRDPPILAPSQRPLPSSALSSSPLVVLPTTTTRIRTGFEVDAPTRSHKRRPPTIESRAGPATATTTTTTNTQASAGNRREYESATNDGKNRQDAVELTNSRHRALMEGLTDEQRAWAGIEALLLMSSRDGDSNSVATRDVLPDAIIKAMSANRSISTLDTARFLDDSAAGDWGDGVRGDEVAPGSGKGAALHAEVPGLVDASFSSLQSEATRQTLQTVGTAATQNYVLPSAMLPRQRNALSSYRPNHAPTSMNAYMSQLCSRQQQQREPQPQQGPVKPGTSHSTILHAADHEDPTETEESIDLFATDCNHDVSSSSDGGGAAADVREIATEASDDDQDASNADSYVDDDQEGDDDDDQSEGEGEADEQGDCDDDDDDSDDHSRMLIQQYTHGLGSSRRQPLPDLMNASFSSVRTEMSGIMSLISTARNYVVQQDDVNPMGVFLGNITRNLERKQEASLVEDDDERVRYMYERDEIADVRRQILEEEIERYHQGEYDGWHQDYDEYGMHVHQGQRPDEVSMPSLEPMKASDDISPLPSPYSNVTPPFEGVRPPPAGDWRAWVDGAFKPGTGTLSPVPLHPGNEAQAPSRLRPSHAGTSQRKNASPKPKKKPKKKADGAPPRPRNGPATSQASAPGKNAVRKVKPVDIPAAAPKIAQVACTAWSPPVATAGSTSILAEEARPLHPATAYEEEEEVISLSQLRVPVSSCTLLPSDLPRAMPTSPVGRSSSALPQRPQDNKKKARQLKKYDPKASPLVSLRQRMARLYSFGKGVRRGSPASVLDYGSNGNGGIAAGRGDESRFFPTIEEEDEEDWSNQLLPHHS